MSEQLREQAEQSKILEICSGSYLYGTNTPESDRDYMGIFMPSEEYVFGLSSVQEVDFGTVSKNANGKNNSSAIDRKLYEFRKFISLAMYNNPNILEILFCDPDKAIFIDEIGRKLLENKHLFPSKLAAKKFIGYAHSQRHKMIIKKDSFNNLQEGYEVLKITEDKLTMGQLHDRMENSFDHKKLFIKKPKGIHIYIGDVCFEPGVYVKKARKLLKERLDKVTNRSELVLKHGFDCYHENTEFLTLDGWKFYQDIKEEEQIGTINPKTFILEFEKPYERICKPYKGDLYEFVGNYTRMCVTSNHRMFVSPAHRSRKNNFSTKYNPDNTNWQLKPLCDIFNSNRSTYHVLTSIEPNKNDYPISDEYLTLLGLFISDGTFHKFKLCNSKKIPRATVICSSSNSKPGVAEAMKSVSDKYSFRYYSYPRINSGGKSFEEYKWVSYDKELTHKIFKECGHGSRNKKLPLWFYDLSQRQAEILLYGLYLGDGTQRNTYTKIYYTVNKKLADQIQILALLAGKDSNVLGPYTSYSSYTKKNLVSYQVSFSEKTSIPKGMTFNPKNKKTHSLSSGNEKNNGGQVVPYSGNIVCFSVPNEILITRYKGKVAFQGNTKFGSHLIRLLTEGLTLLKEGEIIFPLPNAQEIVDIKTGKMSLQEVIKYAEDLEKQLDSVLESSTLPATPYYKDIQGLTIKEMKGWLNGYRMYKMQKTNNIVCPKK